MNILKTTGKLMSKFIGFIWLLIVIMLIIYIFQITILKKEYANIFGFTLFYIKTGSMEPTLEVGDGVLVRVTKNISINDIAIYQDENKDFICHRLVENKNGNFIFKGDANNSEDEPATYPQIIGKVLIKIPKFKLIQLIF